MAIASKPTVALGTNSFYEPHRNPRRSDTRVTGLQADLKNENDFQTFFKAKVGVHFADGYVTDMGNVAGQGLP